MTVRSTRSALVAAGELDETERHHALATLRRLCGEGHLSLEEFASRAGAVVGAVTADELTVALSGLPAAPLGPHAPAAPSRWVSAVFGSSRHDVRWWLTERLALLAVFGGVRLDVSGCTVASDGDVDITAVAVFGTVKVVVPAGIDVDVTGTPVFGTRKGAGAVDDDAALPGAPTVRVRAVPIFGTVKVLRG